MTDRIILAQQSPFALGPLMVHPSTCSVTRDGRDEILEPRVMQVLVALARAHGAVVSRDDLIASCWEGRIVGDDAINRVLSRLRRLTEGLGADTLSIQTITRVGYRLVVKAEGAAAVPDRAGPGSSNAHPISRRMLLAGGAGTGLAVVGAGVWIALHNHRKLPPAAQEAMDAGLTASRQASPEQVSEAIAAFQKATALAPDFAEPWAQLALAYRSNTGYVPPSEAPLWVMRSREAANRALAIDPDNADAKTALTALFPWYRHWREAGAQIEAVLARHPDNFAINIFATSLYPQVGRIRDVQRCTRRAFAIDPQWEVLFANMVLSSWVLGELDQADTWLTQATAQWPRYYGLWFIKQRYLAYTGRAAQAVAMIEDVPNRPSGIPDWNFEQCRLESQALLTQSPGDIDAAVKGYRAEAARGVGFAENAVQFFSQIGLVDEAFELLALLLLGDGARFGENRYSAEQAEYTSRRSRNTWILWMPMSARMRADARLLPILREIGLVDYWHATGTRPDVPVAGL